jgi:hypothetical protein
MESAAANCFGEHFDLASWEMDEELRHIERILQAEKNRPRRRRSVDPREAARLDPAHADKSPKNLSDTGASSPQNRNASPRSPRTAGRIFSTLFLTIAAAMLVCGGVLWGWSMVEDRQDLWRFGLPIALGGQIALLIGMLLQLERFHREHHSTAEKITAVDRDLHDLKTTALRWESAQNPLAGAFYAHYASGANPQVLLGDLKSQLDLLASKIGPFNE